MEGYKACKVKNLKEGDIVAEDIYKNDFLLLSSGVSLTKTLIAKLQNDVYKDNINKTIILVDIKEDISDKLEGTLILSDDVKSRVTKSIDYMYFSKDPEEVAEIATSISEVLVSEVLKDSCSAVCLDSLKLCDNYTFNHCIDVASISMVIAKECKFSEKMIKEIGTAGILHDIGKQDIPLSILNKAGKLTDDEFDLIKKHPTFSYLRVKDTSLSNDIKLGILQHHERYCGGGYPLNISGNNISPIARLLTVSDVYAALVTERPYKNAVKPSECIEMMYGMFLQFDVDYFKKFLDVLVIYSNGSTITLSSGDTAKVIKQNKGYPLRPTIRINEEIVDLSRDCSYLNLIII